MKTNLWKINTNLQKKITKHNDIETVRRIRKHYERAVSYVGITCDLSISLSSIIISLLN